MPHTEHAPYGSLSLLMYAAVAVEPLRRQLPFVQVSAGHSREHLPRPAQLSGLGPRKSRGWVKAKLASLNMGSGPSLLQPQLRALMPQRRS